MRTIVSLLLLSCFTNFLLSQNLGNSFIGNSGIIHVPYQVNFKLDKSVSNELFIGSTLGRWEVLTKNHSNLINPKSLYLCKDEIGFCLFTRNDTIPSSFSKTKNKPLRDLFSRT